MGVKTVKLLDPRLLMLGVLILVTKMAVATPIAFQDPGTATWGNWNRGDAGTLYAAWDVATASSLPEDNTPDLGNLNTTSAVLQTFDLGNPTPGGSAFITSTFNIYSFSAALDFDIEINANYGADATPTRIALQLSTLGAALDLASVTYDLFGTLLAPNTTNLLASGSAPNPTGPGVGLATEYLFIWDLPFRPATYDFNFWATGSSLSLDAASVDVGPTGDAPLPPPDPPPVAEATQVPFPPAAIVILAAALSGFGIRQPERTALAG
ncbi:MAG: hypothetical protein AAF384_12985 [Pseudomonadota bacterium]